MASCRGSCRQAAVGHFGRNVNAVCFIYCLRLRHQCLAESAQAGLCRDAVECRTSESADRTKTNIPPELEPDIPADILTDHRVEACTGQNLAENLHATRQTPIGFAQCKSLKFLVLHHAGRNNFGGWLDHTTNSPFGAESVPQPPTWIDRFEMVSFKRTTAFVKIPPRNAIYCRDNRGIVPQQREKFRSARIGLMCLQRADHDVLRTKCSWVIARLNPGDLRVALGQQFQTVLLDRLKMCAAGNGTNVMSCQR